MAFALVSLLSLSSSKGRHPREWRFSRRKIALEGRQPRGFRFGFRPLRIIRDGYQTGGASGIVVELGKARYWPKAYQTFNTHDNSFNYSVTFKLSADYAPASNKGFNPPPSRPSDASNPFGPRNELLPSVLDGGFVGALTPPTGNDFLLLVVDLTAEFLFGCGYSSGGGNRFTNDHRSNEGCTRSRRKSDLFGFQRWQGQCDSSQCRADSLGEGIQP